MEETLDSKVPIPSGDMILLIRLIIKAEFSHLMIFKVLMNLVILFSNRKSQKGLSFLEEKIHSMISLQDLEVDLVEDLVALEVEVLEITDFSDQILNKWLFVNLCIFYHIWSG